MLLMAMLATLAGCKGPAADDGPVTVSAIGDTPELRDANRAALSPADRILAAATAQGLVTFDENGQISPALAERWTVSDDGLSYLFRLREDAAWPDGDRITTSDIARRLRAVLAARSTNPLKDLLAVVDEIVAVTPEVIEIRLAAPRPHLLDLLAQPQLGMVRDKAGSGPMRIERREARALLLAPYADPPMSEAPDPEEAIARTVWLRGETASRAVARYRLGAAELVTGGTIADLPVARAAEMPTAQLRLDNARGLFAFAFTGRQPFLEDAGVRAALSMAVDRERMVRAFGLTGWRPAVAIVPDGLADLPQPSQPGWSTLSTAQRRAMARDIIAQWATSQGPAPLLRIAMPRGSGMRSILARLRADWARIGIAVARVGPDETADLTLVDQVAPADTASWYLRNFSCARTIACSQEAESSLILARDAPNVDERVAKLVEADALMAEANPAIILAAPLRWALVSPRLTGWHENGRGVHPLDRLREARR